MSYEQYQACIDACYRCAAACDFCATACLDEPDPKKMVECIRADLDCAQMCRLAASAMARGSDFVDEICRLCAQICEECGDVCKQHEADHCQQCAQACYACLEECQKMA